MITCVVEYVIDPAQIEAFERFGRRWIELVDSHGGMHHGYFLPAEGASDKALALFSFPSRRRTSRTRCPSGSDPDFIEADRIRDDSGCVLRYERTFMRLSTEPGKQHAGGASYPSTFIPCRSYSSDRGQDHRHGPDLAQENPLGRPITLTCSFTVIPE